MSHYPLYRKSDAHCQEPDGAPPEDKGDIFREGWDCLTRAASSLLLDQLRPALVLSGHTHHGCNTSHPAPGPGPGGGAVQEISVSSFSWRNKKNPAFLLGQFSNELHSLSKCYMPDENTLFTTYYFFISLLLISLFIK